MDYCLEVDNLCKKFSTFQLNNVTIKLAKGTIMGFIGENGAGKTTTIKSILNLITKSSGSVRMFGKDMDNEEEAKLLKEDIGIVLDECCFHDTLKLKQINHIMSKIYKNWDSKLFYSYVEKFNLSPDKVVKEYSKGMKMKLNIAVALAHNPKLLILDEATSGLDPVIRNQILDVFLEFIQDEEHSILLSSHITTDLEKICDYITFIHNGSIIFSKTKDDILDRYAIVRCNKNDYNTIDPSLIVSSKTNRFHTELLINDRSSFQKRYPSILIDHASLEDIMLFYSNVE
ncbi:MAG TPA: ABC transporter ATP-binding protein [Lachnospiraceae bacterium]|nr:ABC transporter ATP-binding protein [Lachnospiraceae bacterium]